MGNESSRDLAQGTKLDRQEINELMKTFNKLANSKGKITKDSIKAALKKAYGDNYDPGLANSLFNLFDKDGSKEVDAKEFILAMGYLTNRSLEDVIETSFRCLDLNNDGFISKGEMRSVCMSSFKMKKWINIHKKAVSWDKIQLSPADIGQINKEADDTFARLDVNKDGQVSREEFLKIANNDPILKQKLTELLVRDESLNIIQSFTASR